MTAKRKASEMLKEPDPCLPRIRAMIELGRVEDDCGFMQNPPPPPAPKPPPEAPRLPAWPEAVRGIPNGVLRSALFGAVKKGPKRYLKREPIASLEGVEIFYTGERLDQGDMDVWQSVLHIARLQGLGNECRVTAYRLLKLLGKADTGKNRDILDQRLTRMNATAVRIKIGRYSYEGSLIAHVFRDEETREYVIRVDANLRPLFDRDQWTAVDWAVRAELAGQPLAQWLHGFYATHAKPYPISVAKLHELCGSEAVDLSDWKTKDLRKSLDAVTKACEKHSQAFNAEIRDDLVYVDRQPSRSQQRHLDKKAKKPKPAGQRGNAMTRVGDLLKPKK